MTNPTTKSNKKIKGLCMCCSRAIVMNKDGELLKHSAPVGGVLTMGYDRCMGSHNVSLQAGGRVKAITLWETLVANGTHDHLIAPLEALKSK